MSSPATTTNSFRRLLRGFRRSRRGSAALEFALVAPIFFALLFAIIETALVFFANQLLEAVAQDSARLIFTGQAQQASYTQDDFKNNVVKVFCQKASALLDCDQVLFDVRSYSSFGNVTINNQIDASGNFINDMQYSPGGNGDIVVVRLFYQWPIFVTGLGYNITNLSGSKRLLVASAAFKNEPYTN